MLNMKKGNEESHISRKENRKVFLQLLCALVSSFKWQGRVRTPTGWKKYPGH